METYRKNAKLYRHVTELPVKAKTVSEYCKEQGFTNPYVYELFKKNKAKFEIVIFQGINFIIPLT